MSGGANFARLFAVRTMVVCCSAIAFFEPGCAALSHLGFWKTEAMKLKHGLLIEDVADSAPPASTDSTAHVNPSEKVQQIGSMPFLP